jgi:polyphosphate kinase
MALAEPMNPESTLQDGALFLNRELSQLEFNARVLAQATDTRMPLLERLRYLCISSTNLDEFFEIRVAAVRHQLEYGGTLGPDGLSPTAAMIRIHERTRTLVADQYQHWNDMLRPELAAAGIRILQREGWTARQKRWLCSYFRDEILPVLSPLGLDPAHPFPRILNKSLNIIVVLQGKDAFGRAGHMAVVRAPRSLPRIIQLPSNISGGPHDFVFLSAVLSVFVDELFPGIKVKGAYQFRVTRNSELFVDEEEVQDLAHALKDELANRGFRRAVRLEIADHCPRPILRTLLKNFELTEKEVYRINGPVNLSRAIQVYDLVDRPDLKFSPLLPRQLPHAGSNIFQRIAGGDVLLHHPFDAFNAVLDLVKQAALDPNVLAIKQTLYRTGGDAILVEHLITAARKGKDVTVVIELRARFDEEANIRLADRLQEAGVQVVYGVVGHKTHAKMLLVVRREGGKLRRYVHLATGNYHAGTARAYTDIGLMTAHPDIGSDVHQIFQQVSGLAPAIKLKRLLQAPFTLHAGIIDKIGREAKHARAGRVGHIIAKMNALTEPMVIRALYEASQAGVKIELIVRGACALRPGVAGISDNITVRSVVGRFLEHTRISWFFNNGHPELYCASADWMDRNLLRRVEISFPILDPVLAKRVYDEGLANYLADNTSAWALQGDGSYRRIECGADDMPHNAQTHLLNLMRS